MWPKGIRTRYATGRPRRSTPSSPTTTPAAETPVDTAEAAPRCRCCGRRPKGCSAAVRGRRPDDEGRGPTWGPGRRRGAPAPRPGDRGQGAGRCRRRSREESTQACAGKRTALPRPTRPRSACPNRTSTTPGPPFRPRDPRRRDPRRSRHRPCRSRRLALSIRRPSGADRGTPRGTCRGPPSPHFDDPTRCRWRDTTTPHVARIELLLVDSEGNVR